MTFLYNQDGLEPVQAVLPFLGEGVLTSKG